MFFEKKGNYYNHSVRIKLDLVNYMINLNSEEAKEYESECRKFGYSLLSLNNFIKKNFKSEEEEKENENNFEKNIELDKINDNEKIEIIVKKEKENKLRSEKDKYYFRKRKPKNNNLIEKKNEKKKLVNHKTTNRIKKEKFQTKIKKEKKDKLNNLEVNAESLYEFFSKAETLAISCYEFFSYLDEKIECKKEKKYFKEKKKMTTEEKKMFIEHLIKNIRKLTFNQIIQIKNKFFNNYGNEKEINLNLDELSQEELKRLNIYVDSYKNDNLLNPSYVPYNKELENREINLVHKKRFLEVKSDFSSFDDESSQNVKSSSEKID